ncbi:hypothetical protein [Spiroplasma endosymbiont of 'Nebria riversi']|uniref:hypothetical protein n=1 Tax=Spiroplasma endosymbiont of 'Nebria riversi' TaxID=2792084 RepID=UPI001C045294|nr:hypothetical protein [Spiroplasma endosymbiont of 'Nebria riversi']
MFAGGAYILKNGETTPTKINFKFAVSNIAIDSNDNVYFSGFNGGTYILKSEKNIIIEVEETIVPNFSSVYSIIVDNNDNIFFQTRENGTFVLRNGDTESRKIYAFVGNVINTVVSDSNNNSYFWTNGYSDGNPQFIKNGELKANQILVINGQIQQIVIDTHNNVYFRTFDDIYVLKSGEITPTEINGINGQINSIIIIDKINNMYICTENGLYVLNSDKLIFKKEIKGNINFFYYNNKSDKIYFKYKTSKITSIKIIIIKY